MVELSIVILTCNQRDLTLKCLASLEGVMSERCELIVVDNGSVDGSAEAIRRLYPGVRLLVHSCNLGVSAGRNSGLREARGEYLMILDNDTIATPSAILGLMDYLKGHRDVGLVAPLLRSPEGRIQHSFKPYPGVWVKIRNVLMKKRNTSYVEHVPSGEIEPFYVIGAAQMFRAELYRETGGLDERIFYGPEDADFCMQVRRLGYRVVLNPEYTIEHDWQRITTRRPWSAASRRHIGALLYFYVKHRRFW